MPFYSSSINRIAHRKIVRLDLVNENLETMKNCDSLAKGYLLNPFDFIYDDDSLVSKNPAIQETLQAARDVTEDRLDLDVPYLKHLHQLHSLSYVPLGCINWTFKFNKTYKKQYSSFEQYCKQELGKSVDAVDNSIDAARVALELIKAGYEYLDLPKNMSQAVVLKKFTGEELIEKWEYVLANLESHERTAPKIKGLLFPPKVSEDTINTKIQLPVDVYSKLVEVAYKAELSICETVKTVVFMYDAVKKKSDLKRILRWILDMVELTSKPYNYSPFQ